jgi:hypothetical protein
MRSPLSTEPCNSFLGWALGSKWVASASDDGTDGWPADWSLLESLAAAAAVVEDGEAATADAAGLFAEAAAAGALELVGKGPTATSLMPWIGSMGEAKAAGRGWKPPMARSGKSEDESSHIAEISAAARREPVTAGTTLPDWLGTAVEVTALAAEVTELIAEHEFGPINSTMPCLGADNFSIDDRIRTEAYEF